MSTSSSPQPSMSSASDSPFTTPSYDSNVFTIPDTTSEERTDGRTGSLEVVPKVEETELQLADVKEEPSPEDAPISPTEPVRIRRARGRPRIHPPRSPTTLAKQAKARSKTGCTTCRKRKKKCDETKPFCNRTPNPSAAKCMLTMSRLVMSKEQHSLRRLQACRDLEERKGARSRRFVVLPQPPLLFQEWARLTLQQPGSEVKMSSSSCRL